MSVDEPEAGAEPEAAGLDCSGKDRARLSLVDPRQVHIRRELPTDLVSRTDTEFDRPKAGVQVEGVVTRDEPIGLSP